MRVAGILFVKNANVVIHLHKLWHDQDHLMKVVALLLLGQQRRLLDRDQAHRGSGGADGVDRVIEGRAAGSCPH